MFDMPVSKGLPRMEEQEFDLLQGADEALGEVAEWLGRDNRAAVITCADASRMVGMSVETYRRFDDLSLQHAYMPHWELDGFAVEDMPTVRDLLWAADKALLEEVLYELIAGAPAPGGNPDVPGALSHALSSVEVLKNLEFDSCDDDPQIAVPYAFYRCDPFTEDVSTEMQVRFYPVAEIGRWNPKPETSHDRYRWSKALGCKAWFGGVSIRESYRALAWLVCKMLRDTFVDYGIWFGELPDDEKDDRAQELAEGALADLHDRMNDLLGRIVPIEELVTVSVDIDEDVLRDFERTCRESGLSVQNALHISLLRLIDDPDGFAEEVGLKGGRRCSGCPRC